MPTLFENVSSGDTTHLASTTSYGQAQCFTPIVTHIVDSVKVKIFRGIGATGTFTASIRATSTNRPTGADLAYGTLDIATEISDTFPPGDWYTINLNVGIELVAETLYALVLKVSPDFTGTFSIRAGGNLYTGIGSSYQGSDESWASNGAIDLLFEEWGEYSSTLFEYYDGESNTAFLCNTSNDKIAQTFTPSISHVIERIELLLFKYGSPGTINIGIYATASDVPTGSALVTGTYDGDSLGTDSAGTWREINLSGELVLTAGTKYAIVMDVPGANTAPNHFVYWNVYDNESVYSDGNAVQALNGVDWSTVQTNADFKFRERGRAVETPTITDQSGDADIESGKLVNLFVTAEGFPTPTYQWYQDDTLISGEISSTLSFYTGSLGISTYKCKVTNDADSIWSSDMVVTVIGNPYTYRLFDLIIDADRED